MDLEQTYNYVNKPGHHSLLSPVIGSRFHELYLIYTFREIFAQYQEAIYTDESYHYIMEPDIRVRAEDIAKELFQAYLAKYSLQDPELTIHNAVYWGDSYAHCALKADESAVTTWHRYLGVPMPTDPQNNRGGRCTSSYLAAIHELMHAEEHSLGIENTAFQDIVEVLALTQTIILADEVYKKAHNLPLESLIDYGKDYQIFGKTIAFGEIANVFRRLKTKYNNNLAEAMVSEDGLVFLGCPRDLYALGMGRINFYREKSVLIHTLQEKMQKYRAPTLQLINKLTHQLQAETQQLAELKEKIRQVQEISRRNGTTPSLLAKLEQSCEQLQKSTTTLELENAKQKYANQQYFLGPYEELLQNLLDDALVYQEKSFITVAKEMIDGFEAASGQKDSILALQQFNLLQEVCERYLLYSRQQQHEEIWQDFLQLYPQFQRESDIHIIFVQFQALVTQENKKHFWLQQHKADLIGVFKLKITQNLLAYCQSINEVNSIEKKHQLLQQFKTPQDKTLEILGLNRQSKGELILKIASLLTLILGGILAGVCYYKTNGRSINFFKPLSAQIQTVITNEMPASLLSATG